jgi:ABC-type nitrate/sulfonate/bicarbonate transport system substrate-binding protein
LAAHAGNDPESGRPASRPFFHIPHNPGLAPDNKDIPMKKLALALATLLLFATQARAEKLTVLLDWFVNPDHATLFVAQEKGFFTARGLDVEFVAPANPNDPPKLVAAGQADLAVSYQISLQLIRLSKNQPELAAGIFSSESGKAKFSGSEQTPMTY